jgi:hypothetical protein
MNLRNGEWAMRREADDVRGGGKPSRRATDSDGWRSYGAAANFTMA